MGCLWNHSFEPEGKPGAPPPPAELRDELLQLGQHFPEQRFGQGGVALPVGVREGILARRGGPANGRKRPRVQPQRIAHVVQSQSMGQLGIDQADHITPGLEGAALALRVVLARQSRHQMVGNQIAQLAQERKAAARCLRLVFFCMTCLVAGCPVASQHLFQVRSLHLSTLWDSCVFS